MAFHFITNKEQGDWAENLIMRAINDNAKKHVAVKYGKSDDLVAGEEGFDGFFQEFQNEMDTIGKRPDLLIFKKTDFDETKGSEKGFDISHVPHEIIDDYVKKAIAGIEVRSSAFLIDTIHVADFKVPGWRSNERLAQLNELLKKLKNDIREIQKRDYLSITPKVEDIKVVYKWIETFNVPHFYFQVFFDKVYGISFENIIKLHKLQIISTCRTES